MPCHTSALSRQLSIHIYLIHSSWIIAIIFPGIFVYMFLLISHVPPDTIPLPAHMFLWRSPFSSTLGTTKLQSLLQCVHFPPEYWHLQTPWLIVSFWSQCIHCVLNRAVFAKSVPIGINAQSQTSTFQRQLYHSVSCLPVLQQALPKQLTEQYYHTSSYLIPSWFMVLLIFPLPVTVWYHVC